MKKADLSIQFIFLILLATIAVFVVVGLISNWSFNANRFVQKLFGNEEEPMEDIQVVNVTCATIDNEIIKHAKLCYSKGKDGLVRGGLCYAILVTGPPCNPNEVNIHNGLTAVPHQYPFTLNTGRKFIIEFDTINQEVGFV